VGQGANPSINKQQKERESLYEKKQSNITAIQTVRQKELVLNPKRPHLNESKRKGSTPQKIPGKVPESIACRLEKD